MCGRYTLTPSRSELEGAFPELAGLPQDRVFAERFNVAPSQEIAVLTTDAEGATRAELMRWGLVPSWSKGPDAGVKMINARSETLRERPSYRGLVAKSKGRCLIPADGFYEWQPVQGGRKQPWRFTVDDGGPFTFAGLCTTWQPPDDGPELRSCTIITTDANRLVEPIHDRMPAIIADGELRRSWLDPAVDGDAACSMLGPFDPARMSAVKASRAVGRPGNEGPSLLIAEEETLF